MFSIEVNHIFKTYGNRAAVDDVSFDVNQGEIFGLIGPNGAGKTTTIRMMMDIIKPDSGDIKVMGEKLNDASKNKIGYLPEERGLYKKMSVMDTIIYFASLKGVDSQLARQRGEELLKRADLLPHRHKRIEELSRGMSQLIQVIITVIHEPDLIILDEPFSGLDPVNTQLLKDLIRDLKNKGKTIIMSTHLMNDIEELCDRLLMINKGHAVLYGSLAEVKSKYRNNAVLVETAGEMGTIEGVTEQRPLNGAVELKLDANTTPQMLLERLIKKGIVVNRFELSMPSLTEIFIKVVGDEHE
jgi:ABC-2 type transport system ATP-binding protein